MFLVVVDTQAWQLHRTRFFGRNPAKKAFFWRKKNQSRANWIKALAPKVVECCSMHGNGGEMSVAAEPMKCPQLHSIFSDIFCLFIVCGPHDFARIFFCTFVVVVLLAYVHLHDSKRYILYILAAAKPVYCAVPAYGPHKTDHIAFDFRFIHVRAMTKTLAISSRSTRPIQSVISGRSGWKCVERRAVVGQYRFPWLFKQ